MVSFQRVCWKLPQTQRFPPYREATMSFYTGQHRFYCGVASHARTLALCVLDADGRVAARADVAAAPAAVRDALAPFRGDLAVACECLFAWYWLADLCHEQNIPFVLGHALYRKASHGGKAKNDRIDAELRDGAADPWRSVWCGPALVLLCEMILGTGR
jgi:hypothetical protein